MATDTKKLKISDFFNPITNPSGGFGMANTTPSMILKGGGAPAPDPLSRLNLSRVGLPPATGITNQNVLPEHLRKTAAAPAAPSPSAAPVPLPVSGGPVAAPITVPPGETGRAPASQTPVPAQWMKPDGSAKTADEIAADIAATLRSSSGVPDVGRLSLEQFGMNDMTTEEARAQARRIGNIRNDIAVGETDPYQVASQSGIAYSPQELAAIEKAYAGIYDPALDTALTKVETKQAEDAARAEALAEMNKPYTLGKDEVRYDAQGNPIAVGLPSSTGTFTGTYTPGSDATVDAWVKMLAENKAKLENVPEEIRGAVAQGLSQMPNPINEHLLDRSAQALTQIDTALDLIEGTTSGLINTAGGPISRSLFGGLPGSDANALRAALDPLRAIIGFDELTQMRANSPTGASGLGQVTEREIAFLQSVMGSLDAGQKTEQLTKTISDIRESFERMQADILGLTEEEYKYLRYERGYSPKEMRALVPPKTSFNAVGNTTASTGNRPQRNNNPGNVKAGGLADSLAVGTDDQGHLVFRTPEDGFKALAMDLTAKVNGASRYLPPNPTIRQLGKVYAEDPNWPIKVAGMLGVSPDTPTQSVPFQTLMQAVARQEGFYA